MPETRVTAQDVMNVVNAFVADIEKASVVEVLSVMVYFETLYLSMKRPFAFGTLTPPSATAAPTVAPTPAE